MDEVSVPERGERHISADSWDRLRKHQAIWHLADRKTLTVKSQRDGSVVLSGGNKVGLVRCGETTVAITEKIPGALTALLSHYSGTIRTLRQHGLASSDGHLLDRLVQAFLSSVLTYVSDGRDWRYKRVKMTGSVVGGRLLVPQTLRLRAAGRRELVAYDKRVISHVTGINQCVAAALRLTEHLHSDSMISGSTVATARALAPFFEDNNSAEVLLGSPSDRASTAADLATVETGVRADVLELAAVILGGAGIGAEGDAGRAPLTWFVNLEDLFERVVRDLLARTLAGWDVVKGGGQAYLFPNVAHLDVNPDLVLTRLDGLTMVGDVKYKDLVGNPTASDLYQLVAHAGALGAADAFLVYPAATNSLTDMGNSTAGPTVRVFCLDVANLENAVTWMMHELLAAARRGQYSDA